MPDQESKVSTETLEEGDDQTIDILVVEDNDSERKSIVAVLQGSIPAVRVASVCNGDDALDFVFARGDWSTRTDEEPPKLILLDLELPGTTGFSVLGQIRAIVPEDALTLTPVVVFTDSGSMDNIRASYRCGANSYIIKPISFSDFRTVVEAVGKYWMSHNKTSE
jgi:two-component system response regulator